MSEYLPFEESAARLHKAGWLVADSNDLLSEGPIWCVKGTRGKDRIFASDSSRDRAWQQAVRQAAVFERRDATAKKGIVLEEPALFTFRNELLKRVPAADFHELRLHTRQVSLKAAEVLYEPEQRVNYVYFPVTSIITSLIHTEDGSCVESISIGREGFIGSCILLETNTTSRRDVVLTPGDAYRIDAAILRAVCRKDNDLRRLLLRYTATQFAQVGQLAACNALHTTEQRCCRWLLIAREQLQKDEIPITHEMLAMLLGVRRASVTEVLQPLHQLGALKLSRGKVSIHDRHELEATACECARTIRKEMNRLLGPLV